ncbi:MAG: hypothetical protein IKP40_04010 [Clostridia bacterium]|nr:hypothetical protein [Clostridia bacterium]
MRLRRWLIIAIAALMLCAGAFAEDSGGNCGVVYTYGEHGDSFRCWSPNGDGTHSSVCVVSGCDHRKTVPCTFVQLEIEGEVLELCPICGDIKGGEAELLPLDVEVTAACHRGWLGHPQVFMGEKDGYVFFSACYERGGYTAYAQELRIQVTMPADALKGLKLRALGGVSNKGLSCDWVDESVVLGLRLNYRQPALLLFSKTGE